MKYKLISCTFYAKVVSPIGNCLLICIKSIGCIAHWRKVKWKAMTTYLLWRRAQWQQPMESRNVHSRRNKFFWTITHDKIDEVFGCEKYQTHFHVRNGPVLSAAMWLYEKEAAFVFLIKMHAKSTAREHPPEPRLTILIFVYLVCNQHQAARMKGVRLAKLQPNEWLHYCAYHRRLYFALREHYFLIW